MRADPPDLPGLSVVSHLPLAFVDPLGFSHPVVCLDCRFPSACNKHKSGLAALARNSRRSSHLRHAASCEIPMKLIGHVVRLQPELDAVDRMTEQALERPFIVGTVSLISRVAEQCPQRRYRGESLMCPASSPACKASIGTEVAKVRRLARHYGFPPRPMLKNRSASTSIMTSRNKG